MKNPNNQHFVRSSEPELDMTTRSAAVRADSLNDEARTVEAVFSTEKPTDVYDWNRGIVREILVSDGIETDERIPMLDCHSRWSVRDTYGSGLNVRVENGQVIGTLEFADDPDSDAAFRKVRGKHVRSVSVGYQSLVFTDIEPNESATIDGRTFTAGPEGLRVTSKWKLREISITPVGANDEAKIRALRGETRGPIPNKNEGAEKMNLREFLKTLGLRADASDAEVAEFIKQLEGENKSRALALHEQERQTATAPPANSAPAAPPVDIDAERQAAQIAERKRIQFIQERAEGVPDELVARAISEGWDENRASREFLDAIRSSRSTAASGNSPAIHVQPDVNRDALASALSQRIGRDPVNPKASEADRQRMERAADAGRRYADFSLMEMVRAIVDSEGLRDPISGGTPHGRQAYIRAAVSGGSLAYVFTTNINAAMMQAYQDAPDSTIGLTRDVDVPNFQSREVIDFDVANGMKKLPRGTEAKHITVSDAEVTYKISRYAEQFVIDEQDIIDDRLDFFSRIPERMGQDARRLRPDLFYALLLSNPTMGDGGALFNATAVTTAGGHANLGSSDFSSTTLKTAVAAMGVQKKNGVNINVRPRYLIVPVALEMLARETLFSASLLIARGGTTDATIERGSMNVITDIGLDLRVDARIDNGLTNPADGSAVSGDPGKWFLSADPNQVPTIEFAYLSGTGRAPMVERFNLTGGQWGFGYKVKMDVGIKELDWRGLYAST